MNEQKEPTLKERFEAWQNLGEVHPFTCGGGGSECSGVELEFHEETEDAFDLWCPKCGRHQVELKASTLGTLVTLYPVQGLRQSSV